MPTKIAFVSCAYSTFRKQQPAWKQIRDAEPDLLLMLGDNAYMSWDGNQFDQQYWKPEDLEICYAELFQKNDFVWLTENVPTLAIWDDHDAGPNDTYGALLPHDKLKAVRDKFNRWMGFAVNDNRPHMYCAYLDIPDLKIVMLDVRTYRNRFNAPDATLLGKAQEDWLWEQLLTKPGDERKFTIVCSGTGFTEGARQQRVKDYKDFARDLKKALKFRPETGEGDLGRRSLFLAGDIHRNHFGTLGDVQVHEVISSGVACFRSGTAESDFSNPLTHIDKWGLLTIGDETIDIAFHGWTPQDPKFEPEPRHVAIRVSDWQVVSKA